MLIFNEQFLIFNGRHCTVGFEVMIFNEINQALRDQVSIEN
jgi:hypothetical protein